MKNAHEQTASTVNALTIDVEDYFQVSALAPHIARERWDSMPCRVERNVERLLALLDENGARATFFTLGWIAQRYPGVVRDIVAVLSPPPGPSKALLRVRSALVSSLGIIQIVLPGEFAICGRVCKYW